MNWRTAPEWVEQLGKVLGLTKGAPGSSDAEAVQPVRQVTEPHPVDSGPPVDTKIPFDTHTFTLTALARYLQVRPRGYYDGVQVAVITTNTTSRSYPVFLGLDSLQSVESETGYAMGVTAGAFAGEHPPLKAVPAAANSNSLEVNLPLTNSPLIVWIDDGIAPGSIGTVKVRVTLMTRRH